MPIKAVVTPKRCARSEVFMCGWARMNLTSLTVSLELEWLPDMKVRRRLRARRAIRSSSSAVSPFGQVLLPFSAAPIALPRSITRASVSLVRPLHHEGVPFSPWLILRRDSATRFETPAPPSVIFNKFTPCRRSRCTQRRSATSAFCRIRWRSTTETRGRWSTSSNARIHS